MPELHPVFKLYSKSRSYLLKASFLILLGVTLTGATTTDKRSIDKSQQLAKQSIDQTIDQSDQSSDDLLNQAPKPVIVSPKSSKGRLTRTEAIRLLKSAIPSIKSPVIFYLLSQLILLTVRAFLTIKVASLDGRLVAALINKRTKKFLRLLVNWMVLGIPASIINSLLQLTQSKLSQNIRLNITNAIMNDYLPTEDGASNFYTLIHLDNEINDPDQRISTDIDRLANAAASLPGQLLKPSLDLLLCAKELSKSGVGGAEGTLALGLVAHFSTIFLTFLSPPFAKLASERANLEGQLRSSHSKIVSNNEEVAFLRGHPREIDFLDECYYQLERFSRLEFKLKSIHDIAQTFIVKYTWGAAGLILCSVPIFVNKYLNKPIDESTSSNFITNRRLLVSASSSLGRLLHARRYVAQVVGHASRVGDFQSVLYKIKHNLPLSKTSEKPIPNLGTVETDSTQIGFYNIPLITPTNQTLCKSLSFRVNHGQHLLISGPNGCGKSSLFRILGGLWPLRSGVLKIPDIKDMFYLPQRAYLSKGSLCEQIIYPDTLQEYYDSNKNDQDLVDILIVLKLDELANLGALNQYRDWNEELSMGVQQRLAMARLYYHKPKFAILDECTSAVPPEMEQFMYKHAQSLGISLLSVAHRPALWHFHDLILTFDGKGGYYFGALDSTKRLKYEEERLALVKNLREVGTSKERLESLKEASRSQYIKRNSNLNLATMSAKASI